MKHKSNPTTNSFQLTWLKRASRELSISGKISELSFILSQKNDYSSYEWEVILRKILYENHLPSIELIMEIESILATKIDTNVQKAVTKNFFGF